MNGIMQTFLLRTGLVLALFFNLIDHVKAGNQLPTSVTPQNLIHPDYFSHLPECTEARRSLGDYRNVVDGWNSNIPASLGNERKAREGFRSEACAIAQAYNMGEYRELSNAYALRPNSMTGRNLQNANVRMCLLNEACRLNGLASQRLNPDNPLLPRFIRRARQYQACELARRTLAVRSACQGPSSYYFLDYARRSQTITIPAPEGDHGDIGEASCTASMNSDGSSVIGKAESSLYDDVFDRFDSDPNRTFPSTALLPPDEIGYQNCGMMI